MAKIKKLTRIDVTRDTEPRAEIDIHDLNSDRLKLILVHGQHPVQATLTILQKQIDEKLKALGVSQSKIWRYYLDKIDFRAYPLQIKVGKNPTDDEHHLNAFKLKTDSDRVIEWCKFRAIVEKARIEKHPLNSFLLGCEVFRRHDSLKQHLRYSRHRRDMAFLAGKKGKRPQPHIQFIRAILDSLKKKHTTVTARRLQLFLEDKNLKDTTTFQDATDRIEPPCLVSVLAVTKTAIKLQFSLRSIQGEDEEKASHVASILFSNLKHLVSRWKKAAD